MDLLSILLTSGLSALLAAGLVSGFVALVIQRDRRKLGQELSEQERRHKDDLARRDERVRYELAAIEYFRTHQGAAIEARNREFVEILRHMETAISKIRERGGQVTQKHLYEDLREFEGLQRFWVQLYPTLTQQLRAIWDVPRDVQGTSPDAAASADRMSQLVTEMVTEMHRIMGSQLLLSGTILDDVGHWLRSRPASQSVDHSDS